jgi:hypothetical protein
MSGCQTCGGFGMHHDPVAHGWDSEECSDTCRRMVCEWCPEYDRQAALVEEFRGQVAVYTCSQAPHAGEDFYGPDGGCAECGWRP